MSDVILVGGGKGGTGKTTVAVQIARASAARNRSTVLVDASLSYGCVDLHLGLSPVRDLGDVLQCRARLDEVIIPFADKLEVLPGATGSPELADLMPPLSTRFSATIELLAASRDTVVIDASTGLHQSALAPVGLADRVVVVMTPDPTAIVGCYAFVRALAVLQPHLHADIVVNQVQSEREGADAHWRLREALIEYHGTDAVYLCSVPWDAAVRESVVFQSPVESVAGASGAAGAFARLSRSLFGEEEVELSDEGATVVPFCRETSELATAIRSYQSQE